MTRSVPLTMAGKNVGTVKVDRNDHVSFELEWDANSILGSLITQDRIQQIKIELEEK